MKYTDIIDNCHPRGGTSATVYTQTVARVVNGCAIGDAAGKRRAKRILKKPMKNIIKTDKRHDQQSVIRLVEDKTTVRNRGW